MAGPKFLRQPPWPLVSLPVAGLLIAIAIAGLAGLALNRKVQETTDRALRYDMELKNVSSDLRVAILVVGHNQHNLVYVGSTRGGVERFDDAFRTLLLRIDELERIGVVDARMPPPGELRQLAWQYYSGFRPAFEQYYSTRPDPARSPLEDTSPERRKFLRASDESLARLERLETLAVGVDKLGEERAEGAMESIERASQSASRALFAILGGLALIGTGLGYSVVRMTSEVRTMYNQQQETSEKLARALQAKTEFIADASHELRTPITIVRGNAEVGLAMDCGCVHAELLEEIVRGAGRMSRVVEDLLFLARSDSDSIPLKLEEVSIASLVRDIVEPAEILASQNGVRLVTEPRAVGRVRVDVARIEQAMLILLDNAIKYGGSAGTVLLACVVEGDRLRIAVTDRGPGIPAAELPKIFERFYRVDKARARKLGGAGLGLAIAKTIVEAHHGRIEAQSRVGHGTTMTIWLPLIGPEPQPAEPRELAPAAPPPAPD